MSLLAVWRFAVRAYVILREVVDSHTNAKISNVFKVVLVNKMLAQRWVARLNDSSNARRLRRARKEHERVVNITGRPHPIRLDDLAMTYTDIPTFTIEEHDLVIGDQELEIVEEETA